MEKVDVFLIDDDAVTRSLIPEYLKGTRFKVCSFEDAEGAIEALLEERYDPKVIIADYNLPGMNGIEFLRQSKQIAQSIPVVLITAYSDNKVITRAWSQGVFDFIEKPIEASKLIESIEIASTSNGTRPETNKLIQLKKYEKTHRKNSFASQERNSLDSEALIDWEFANALKSSLSDDKIQEIILQLKLQSYDDLKKLFNGIIEGNWPNIKDSAHRMKGMSANMGLVKACELCGQLENAQPDSDLDFLNLAFEIEKVLLNSIELLFSTWNLQLEFKKKAS